MQVEITTHNNSCISWIWGLGVSKNNILKESPLSTWPPFLKWPPLSTYLLTCLFAVSKVLALFCNVILSQQFNLSYCIACVENLTYVLYFSRLSCIPNS